MHPAAPRLLAGAALTMHPAAPRLLAHGPACLPIGEAISAIVWVSRWCRRRWHSGELCRAALVVHSTAPSLFIGSPRKLCTHCTIEGIDGAPGSGRWRWRRRGRRRGWQSRGGGDRGCTPHPCSSAAILLLLLRPQVHPIHTWIAIEQGGRAQARQQPAQQRDQQQQAQQAANCDEASEVPPWSHCVEVSAATDVLVGGLLDVLTLSAAHIRHRPLAAATAGNTASCALLPGGDPTSATIAIGAASDNSSSTSVCGATIGGAAIGSSSRVQHAL